MGKLKDGYNKSKPSPRQIKKQEIKNKESINNINICNFLEKKWNNSVKFSCSHCLQEAYCHEINNTQGYVTDEELIVSSNYKLKHK